ncbi:TetR/AcrR family transcriptional regulator [Arthrobacter sp. Z4-13]
MADADQSPLRHRAVQERSVKTRTQILNAAITVLTTDGYAGATTTRIQEAAGVSRGRLLHHFPSRNELLVAAVQRLATTRMGLLQQRSIWPDRPADRLDAAIEAMWETHQQSYFWASTELWIAARHDEQLLAVLLPGERALGQVIQDTVRSFFGPQLSALPNYQALANLLLTSMRGTALTYALTGAPAATEPAVDEWKQVARCLLGITPSGAPSLPAP